MLLDVGATLETIRGTITQIHYSERGYTIAKILVDAASRKASDGTRRPSTMKVLGSMIDPQVHQLYEFTGSVEFNSKFCSHDMRFESYRTILPTDNDGIFSYLVDTARWVGPSTAKALIEAFGDQTLEVIKNDHARVVALGLANLGADRLSDMAESLRRNEKLEAATIEVNNLLAGILGPSVTRKAVTRWGCDAGTILRANPFELMRLHGVGFVSADAVHKKLGLDPQDIQRHAAAVCHVLGEAAARNGHTVVPMVHVAMEGQRLVGGLRQDVWTACEADQLAESDGVTASLGELAAAERYVASRITVMSALRTANTAARCFPSIPADGLAEDQIAAVEAFRWASVFCLVGAPGTGKTYTLARIVKTLQDAGLIVDLCAPTGKAAKQMSLALANTCGGTAVTIHSLLEPTVDEDSGEFRFGRDEAAPLECDVLVVDELSMVDIRLMRSLLRAVRDTTRLLLVGDPYQLPSVGPGAVLRDLLRAGVPAFELRQIKRNAGDIVRACHAIKDGRSPAGLACGKLDLDGGHNWRHIEAANPEQIRDVIERLVRDLLPKMQLNMMWDVQVISPINEKGELSCDAVNKLLRPILNAGFETVGKFPLAVGDKVLRTKNAQVDGREIENEQVADGGDGKIRVVNGDIGIIREISDKTVTVEFKYPGRLANLKRSEHDLKLAYCMTCHKLQGSECQVVILPIHQSFARMPMVTREWIYTAMSRAKRFLVTVGDVDALDGIVPRVGMHQRQTMLARLLDPAMRAV